MEGLRWRNIVELVGITAVVASLIFVGVQLRQDQQIAVAQLYADFDDTQIELSRLLIENQEVWLAGSSGEELSSSEQFMFDAVAEAVVAKHTGFIARAVRLETQPVEGYVVRFASLLHTLPGLGDYYKNRCEFSRQLGVESQRCNMVLPYVAEFATGTRKIPSLNRISP